MNWISVNDRLPEIGKSVLICNKSGRVKYAWRRDKSNYKNPDKISAWQTFCGVTDATHWMPLPEPPKD